jgi:hypothetical protein
MYFSHAFKMSLLGTSPFSPSTATATSGLTAGQIGLYNSSYAAVTYAAAATTQPFYIVQGSYYKSSGYSDTIGSHGGYQESVKSKLINPKYISRIFWVGAKAPVQQVVQIPVSCGLTCDTTYRLRVDVKGSPALRFLSHNIYRVLDSYTGCCNTTNPTFVKDPVATIVDWKEQINTSAYFNQMVQARAYKFKGNVIISGIGSPTTTGTTFTFNTTNTSGVAVGQRITGTNMPINSFVTAVTATATATVGAGGTATTSTYTVTSGNTLSGAVTLGSAVTGAGFPVGSYISAYSSTTSYTITYPTQIVAPALSGVLTVSATCTISWPTQSTAPSLVTGTFKSYNDLYGANGGTTTFFNTVVGTGVQPTYVGQATYIPATNTQALPTGTATGATIGALATTLASTSAAHVYVADADAATFTTDCFLELTAAYVETKFGNSTFTVTDNYDLEPLKIIASVMDDAGDPCLTTCIGSSPNIGVAGIATEVQTAQQAQGVGETVLRDLILTGRYRQEAFGDGINIDTFRMREIEANPGVLNMLSVANRNGLYNKLCILHNVPRWNNPTGVFDNDQYLIEIAVPQAVGLSSFFASTTTSAGKLSTITNSGSSLIGDYIASAANIANGASGATISAAAAVVPVEVY